MGFFDEEASVSAVDTNEISGPVPHDEAAQEFFAENQEEEVLEDIVETPEVSEEPVVDDVWAQNAEPAPSEPPSTQVPLSDLMLERKRRQEMEGELQEQRQNLAVLNERVLNAQRMQQMQAQQAQQQQQIEQNPVPDPEEDPLGAANYKIDLLQNQLRNVAQMTAQQQQQMQQTAARQQQETALNDIVQQSQNLQNDFARGTPDYWEAFNHLIESRKSELTTMGYSGQDLEQVIDNEKGMIVNSCMERDKRGQVTGWRENPAVVAYNLARQRGYVSLAEQQAQQPQPEPEPQREPVQVPADQRMDMMNRGVAASRSAGDMGATANQGALSLDQISNMSDMEFERFQADNPGVIDALLGS